MCEDKLTSTPETQNQVKTKHLGLRTQELEMLKGKTQAKINRSYTRTLVRQDSDLQS